MQEIYNSEDNLMLIFKNDEKILKFSYLKRVYESFTQMKAVY